jgi:hypothetical protein
MRIRKIFIVAAVLALPLATMALLEGTAVAKKVTGSGTTTCKIGGTISFSPPLTPGGSTSIKKEVTTVSATFSSCAGGMPVGSTPSVKVKPVKIKTAKGAAGGTCASFTSNASTTTLKVKVNWAGEKPSKFDVVGLNPGANLESEVGFTGSFTVSGSYGGSGSLGVYLTTASSNAIATCGGGTSVSSLSIDSSTSSGSI